MRTFSEAQNSREVPRKPAAKKITLSGKRDKVDINPTLVRDRRMNESKVQELEKLAASLSGKIAAQKKKGEAVGPGDPMNVKLRVLRARLKSLRQTVTEGDVIPFHVDSHDSARVHAGNVHYKHAAAYADMMARSSGKSHYVYHAGGSTYGVMDTPHDGDWGRVSAHHPLGHNNVKPLEFKRKVNEAWVNEAWVNGVSQKSGTLAVQPSLQRAQDHAKSMARETGHSWRVTAHPVNRRDKNSPLHYVAMKHDHKDMRYKTIAKSVVSIHYPHSVLENNAMKAAEDAIRRSGHAHMANRDNAERTGQAHALWQHKETGAYVSKPHKAFDTHPEHKMVGLHVPRNLKGDHDPRYHYDAHEKASSTGHAHSVVKDTETGRQYAVRADRTGSHHTVLATYKPTVKEGAYYDRHSNDSAPQATPTRKKNSVSPGRAVSRPDTTGNRVFPKASGAPKSMRVLKGAVPRF